jgi:hypothetical protein
VTQGVGPEFELQYWKKKEREKEKKERKEENYVIWQTHFPFICCIPWDSEEKYVMVFRAGSWEPFQKDPFSDTLVSFPNPCLSWNLIHSAWQSWSDF